ncbi:hypothetical protein K6762_002772, partial [Enterococcus faecalis]|nr:hypothetical protein [Enterococcus faecalis]
NLFATSLEEMQLAMQGILVLNETTVKSNGLYTLPSVLIKVTSRKLKKKLLRFLKQPNQK